LSPTLRTTSYSPHPRSLFLATVSVHGRSRPIVTIAQTLRVETRGKRGFFPLFFLFLYVSYPSRPPLFFFFFKPIPARVFYEQHPCIWPVDNPQFFGSGFVINVSGASLCAVDRVFTVISRADEGGVLADLPFFARWRNFTWRGYWPVTRLLKTVCRGHLERVMAGGWMRPLHPAIGCRSAAPRRPWVD